MFQAPPMTRWDLNFQFAGFPIRVSPLFWLIALLFASSARSIPEIIIWVAVVFFSILIHELGHTFAMRMYGVDSMIVLHGFGGLAIPTSSRRSVGPQEQIIISLAGPFAGFAVAAVTLGIVIALGGTVSLGFIFGFVPFPSVALAAGGAIVRSLIGTILWVNIFWGLINLLPVFPLDGGQVSMNTFIQFDPYNGARNALWLSVITGGAIALASFAFLNSFYMAILFGLLAFQSYQRLQRGGL